MRQSVLTRIAGQDPPKMEDNEKTFAEFYDRLQKASSTYYEQIRFRASLADNAAVLY